MNLITVSVKKFAKEIAEVSDSTAWAMIARGEVETISIGKRRLVIVESYRRRVEKLKAQPPQDARRNKTVPPFGSGRSRGLFNDNETAPAAASSAESGFDAENERARRHDGGGRHRGQVADPEKL